MEYQQGVKKVFISYSSEHVERVLELANILASKYSIYVILDKYDVKLGNNLNHFMERGIQEADYVLIICTKNYKEKAEKKDDTGVSKEQSIMSHELYKKNSEDKFVTILFEPFVKIEDIVPYYINFKLHIDFSTNTHLNNNLEELARHIYSKPLIKRPPLGSIPKFVTEEDSKDENSNEQVNLFTSIINTKLSTKVKDDFYLFEEYSLALFDKSLITLNDYDRSSGDIIIDEINKYKDYVRAYIEILESDITNKSLNIYKYNKHIEKISLFFEKLKEGESSFKDGMWDHFKFFTRELIIYTTMLLRRFSKVDDLNKFLEYSYVVARKYETEDLVVKYPYFDLHLNSFNLINQTKQKRRLLYQADFQKERAIGLGIDFDEIIETEYFLMLYSELHFIKENISIWSNWWRPISSVNSGFLKKGKFTKLKSINHFNEFLIEINFSSKGDLIKRYDDAMEQFNKMGLRRTFGGFNQIETLYTFCQKDKLGSL